MVDRWSEAVANCKRHRKGEAAIPCERELKVEYFLEKKSRTPLDGTTRVSTQAIGTARHDPQFQKPWMEFLGRGHGIAMGLSIKGRAWPATGAMSEG